MSMMISGCAIPLGQEELDILDLREVSLEQADTQPRREWMEGQRVEVLVKSASQWVEGRPVEVLVKSANRALMLAITRSIDESGGSVKFDRSDVGYLEVTSEISKWSVTSTELQRGVYRHTVAVEGRIRVWEIPGQRLLDVLHFKEEQTEENRVSKVPDPRAWLDRTFEKAYARVRIYLKNLIAPRGAVVKKALSNRGTVFQIMIGREHLVAPLDKVRIFSTGGGREARIAEGTVTSEISARSCWIIVDDPQSVPRIRAGDVAQLVIKDYASIVAKQTSW